MLPLKWNLFGRSLAWYYQFLRKKMELTNISQTVHSSTTILVDHQRIWTHWAKGQTKNDKLKSKSLYEDHCSYRCNFCSCEKKAWKNSTMYRIRTLDLCNTDSVQPIIELTIQLGAGLNQNHYNVNFELRLHCIDTKQIKNYEDKKWTNLKISAKHFLTELIHVWFSVNSF